MNFYYLIQNQPLKGVCTSHIKSGLYVILCFILILRFCMYIWNASVYSICIFVGVWLIPYPAVVLTKLGSMECNVCKYVCKLCHIKYIIIKTSIPSLYKSYIYINLLWHVWLNTVFVRHRHGKHTSMDTLDSPTIPDGCMATENGRPQKEDWWYFMLDRPGVM
jgi:hypothetical protein